MSLPGCLRGLNGQNLVTQSLIQSSPGWGYSSVVFSPEAGGVSPAHPQLPLCRVGTWPQVGVPLPLSRSISGCAEGGSQGSTLPVFPSAELGAALVAPTTCLPTGQPSGALSSAWPLSCGQPRYVTARWGWMVVVGSSGLASGSHFAGPGALPAGHFDNTPERLIGAPVGRGWTLETGSQNTLAGVLRKDPPRLSSDTVALPGPLPVSEQPSVNPELGNRSKPSPCSYWPSVALFEVFDFFLNRPHLLTWVMCAGLCRWERGWQESWGALGLPPGCWAQCRHPDQLSLCPPTRVRPSSLARHFSFQPQPQRDAGEMGQGCHWLAWRQMLSLGWLRWCF